MTAITFNSVTVDSIEVTRFEQVGSATVYKFECTVECQTATFANYTALAALAAPLSKYELYNRKWSVQGGGTKADLVLNGTTYTNCYIENISAAEAPASNLGVWRFAISFVKDTSL